ncbi:hypothetical protein Salat_2628300 [Sesamum alatum]|uniref:Uncharacterized protein n=1 Tax=Sesamum alatum TaxID=300844 RepID=A0AAE1XNQ3_9LAMI|nr:hypothetical protein Salat_2628300 [Sesamum alatum]
MAQPLPDPPPADPPPPTSPAATPTEPHPPPTLAAPPMAKRSFTSVVQQIAGHHLQFDANRATKKTFSYDVVSTMGKTSSFKGEPAITHVELTYIEEITMEELSSINISTHGKNMAQGLLIQVLYLLLLQNFNVDCNVAGNVNMPYAPITNPYPAGNSLGIASKTVYAMTAGKESVANSNHVDKMDNPFDETRHAIYATNRKTVQTILQLLE